MSRRPLIALCFVAVGACDGAITGGQLLEEGGGPGPSTQGRRGDLPAPGDPLTSPSKAPSLVTACASTPAPGAAPTRRLSHDEYENVVADLFGNATLAREVVAGFLQDPVSLGFRNGARFLDVKPVMMQKYQQAAEAVAAQVTTSAALPRLVACPVAQGEACARQAVERLLTRAFRRPPAPADLDRYVGIWRQGAMGADFRTGMEWVVGAVLQAPKFLYRLELDGPGAGLRALGPYELASRLSFLFWQSAPDDALLEAARAGRLASAADVEREARRLLSDPKADRLFTFFEQWLDVDELAPLRRDPAVFPSLPASLAALLREEAHQFVSRTVLEGDGSFDALMTSNVTFLNEDLARHYGVQGVFGAQWQRHVLGSGLRGGLFMLPAALVSHDKQARTSIVNRGLRVRTQLLCQTVPTPPDDVPLNLQPISGEFSQADRLAQHRTNPSCAGCHALLDPLGEPFENVDAVGRERTRDEGGRPVKTLGAIHATRDANGPVTSGLHLMQRLSASDEARECLVTQLFRFGHGRQEEPGDLCSRQRALQRFKDSNWNVRELFVALTQTDDFLFTPGVTP